MDTAGKKVYIVVMEIRSTMLKIRDKITYLAVGFLNTTDILASKFYTLVQKNLKNYKTKAVCFLLFGIIEPSEDPGRSILVMLQILEKSSGNISYYIPNKRCS